MEIPDALLDKLVKIHLPKSALKVLFFLLEHPESVSNVTISNATGVSQSTVSQAIKKLTEYEMIQPGPFEAEKRIFHVANSEPNKSPTDTLMERIDHLESMLSMLLEVTHVNSDT